MTTENSVEYVLFGLPLFIASDSLKCSQQLVVVNPYGNNHVQLSLYFSLCSYLVPEAFLGASLVSRRLRIG